MVSSGENLQKHTHTIQTHTTHTRFTRTNTLQKHTGKIMLGYFIYFFQVVMVSSDGTLTQQHLVITDGQFAPGTQVNQSGSSSVNHYMSKDKFIIFNSIS